MCPLFCLHSRQINKKSKNNNYVQKPQFQLKIENAIFQEFVDPKLSVHLSNIFGNI